MEQSKFAVKKSGVLSDSGLQKLERNLATSGSGVKPEANVAQHNKDNKVSADTSNGTAISPPQGTVNNSSEQQFAPRVQKDNWDKIAAIAPIISAALIFATGGYCTYTYNQQQIKIQQCQTIEKFIPHLMGNEQTKKAAILALSSLINTETASKFASIFASTGTVSALQTMSETGTDKDKLIATQALSSALQNLAERESQLTVIEQDYKSAVADKTNKFDKTDKADKVDKIKTSGDNPDTPYNLSKLAQVYMIRGQYTLAEPALKRSLEIRERIYGPRHPEVVDALKSLAELYKLSGKTDLAEASLKRARDIEDNPESNTIAKESAVQPVEGSGRQAPAISKGSANGKASDSSVKVDADKAASDVKIIENRAEQSLDPAHSEPHSDSHQP
jgi:tetratricopeptide (TPR) repeat protein